MILCFRVNFAHIQLFRRVKNSLSLLYRRSSRRSSFFADLIEFFYSSIFKSSSSSSCSSFRVIAERREGMREDFFFNFPFPMGEGKFFWGISLPICGKGRDFFEFPFPHVGREEIVFSFPFSTVTLSSLSSFFSSFSCSVFLLFFFQFFSSFSFSFSLRRSSESRFSLLLARCLIFRKIKIFFFFFFLFFFFFFFFQCLELLRQSTTSMTCLRTSIFAKM